MLTRRRGRVFFFLNQPENKLLIAGSFSNGCAKSARTKITGDAGMLMRIETKGAGGGMLSAFVLRR